jgi:ABC-type glycerol-3-phosphate transport system permease component
MTLARSWQRFATVAAVVIILLLIIWPFFYILVSSFKPLKEIMARVRFFPRQPTLKNYETLLFARTPVRDFVRIVANTLIVSSITALVSISISSLSGYSISRSRRLKSGLVSRLLLFIYVFPTIIILIPIYKLFTFIGLWDNFFGLILVYTALVSPFCTWLLVSFFDSIPKELEESCQIDGAGSFVTFTRIVLPLSLPGIVTVGAYSFITAWGEYMFALVIISSNQKKTAALGLATFAAEQYIEWGPLLAGSMLIILPVFLLFLPVAKIFIKGFMAGAVKE